MTPISASQLYSHLTCGHRVYMDAFGDPPLKDPVSPFVQMLWEKGSVFEAETIATLGVSFVDLSGFHGEEKERETRAAIGRGESLIYSGRLSVDDLIGEPDVLRKEGVGYVAIDIKSGGGEESGDDTTDGKPKKTYGVQLALYTDILERLGISAGRYGFIWDVYGDEVRYDLDTPLGPKSPSIADIYADTKSVVTQVLGGSQVTAPANASVCKMCVWRSCCLKSLKMSNDLTLLPELGRAKRDALVAAFKTVDGLATADLSPYAGMKTSPFPGISAATLAKLQVRARLAVHPRPVPFFRDPVTLPVHPLELFFDIEDDPMRDVVYLHGFVVRQLGDNAGERFVSFYSDEASAEGEEEAFAGAWIFMKLHADHMVYYYSKHERTKYRKLQAK